MTNTETYTERPHTSTIHIAARELQACLYIMNHEWFIHEDAISICYL